MTRPPPDGPPYTRRHTSADPSNVVTETQVPNEQKALPSQKGPAMLLDFGGAGRFTTQQQRSATSQVVETMDQLGEAVERLGQKLLRVDAGERALADDAELDRERLTNWGDLLPTRKILRILIAHDLYHAGEINHIRALLQGTDRWPYD